MKKFFVALPLLASLMATDVDAETISFGYLTGTSGNGSVTFWVGSYYPPETNGMMTEGALDLVGTGGTTYGPVSHAFDMTATTLPTGLVLGDNYFKDPTLPMPPPMAMSLVKFWQGVTVTGLAPGDYFFSFTNDAGTTNVFKPWSSNIGTALTVSYDDMGSVPLPAGASLLIGALGLFGLFRRKASKA